MEIFKIAKEVLFRFNELRITMLLRNYI